MSEHQNIVEYIADLKKADIRDNVTFQSLLARGYELLKLVDKDIAREFGISRPTVNRWRSGANAPHPVMRSLVFVWLERRASGLIRRSEFS